jgi:hypothetical protein
MATAPKTTPAGAVSESASKQVLILEDNDGGYHSTTFPDDGGESHAQSRSFDDVDAEHWLG